MSDHQRKADRLDDEVSDLERDSERLGERIGETRSDWERKKADDKVPGAGGDQEAAEPEVESDAEVEPER